MKISNYNQLLAIFTLLSGMIIFSTLWSQYQKIETVSRHHFESRLLVQTVDHLFITSQIWLTTQDLLFSDRQTYLAKGISEQSSQLIQLLNNVSLRVKGGESEALTYQLIAAVKQNDDIVNAFSQLSMEDISAWQKNIADSDLVTTGYVAILEDVYAKVLAENTALSKQLITTTEHFTTLSWVLLSLYLVSIVFVVSWFSKYIVKPIENITALAQQPHQQKKLEFRQRNAPKEIITLSSAIQQFAQHITVEKQKAEQERLNVSQANEKINTIMDTIPCALLLINEQGLITKCNNESEQLFATTKSQINNHYIADFLPALATLEGKFDVASVLKSMEESLLTPRFKKPHVEYSGRKIEIEGRVNYLITISDINERKHSQKALSALNDQLVNAEKLASIGQLSAGIAHEINNPVGYIRSNLDMLKDYFIPIVNYIQLAHSHQQQEDVNSLYKEGDIEFIVNDIEPLISATLEGAARVSKIIKDLGNYAHVDNPEPEIVSIDTLVEQSLSLVTNELKYKVEITTALNAKVDVLGFPQKLLQVFINMLVNASHAIKNKGLIDIQSNIIDGEVSLSFKDNGSGIAEQHLKNIFDPFFTTKPVGKGTGLGLHIVRSIIDEHKGRIDVSSAIGEGSTFTIYLPIYVAEIYV